MTRIYQFHVLAPHDIALELLLTHHPVVQQKWQPHQIHPIKIKINHFHVKPKREKKAKKQKNIIRRTNF